MRIGMFTDRYLPLTDGVTYSVESFRLELERLGHEVYIFAPAPGLSHEEPTERIIRFPAVKGLFFDDYLTTFFFPPQVSKQIDKLNLDIIHFHTPGQVGLFGAYYALHNDIPLVTTYHTDLYEYVKHYPSVLPGSIALSLLTPLIAGFGLESFRAGIASIRPERSITKWNQKIVERGLTMLHDRCDLVIVPSRKIEAKLKRWKSKTPIAILATGINELETTAKGRENLAAKFGISPQDEVILFVGRIGTEKNLSLLLDAFFTIAKKRHQTKLMLVGTGDDMEFFKEKTARAGFSERVIFTGNINHNLLGDAYALANIFVFPSLTDTQGLVVNEAAQASLPIVIVDPDITETVKNEITGLVAPNNQRNLVTKIIAILDDKKKAAAMGKRGKALAENFTPSIQTAKLLRLYERARDYHDAKKTK